MRPECATDALQKRSSPYVCSRIPMRWRSRSCAASNVRSAFRILPQSQVPLSSQRGWVEWRQRIRASTVAQMVDALAGMGDCRFGPPWVFVDSWVSPSSPGADFRQRRSAGWPNSVYQQCCAKHCEIRHFGPEKERRRGLSQVGTQNIRDLMAVADFAESTDRG